MGGVCRRRREPRRAGNAAPFHLLPGLGSVDLWPAIDTQELSRRGCRRTDVRLEISTPAEARVAIAQHAKAGNVHAVGLLVDDRLLNRRAIYATAACRLVPAMRSSGARGGYEPNESGDIGGSHDAPPIVGA
jgi:hypothetical protein